MNLIKLAYAVEIFFYALPTLVCVVLLQSEACILFFYSGNLFNKYDFIKYILVYFQLPTLILVI